MFDAYKERILRFWGNFDDDDVNKMMVIDKLVMTVNKITQM